MAQHDMNIANQGFPAFRSDLNDALSALVSNSSGATAPTTTFAHQFWLDTSVTPNVLKQRNADNDAWIEVGEVDQSADTFKAKSVVGGVYQTSATGSVIVSTGTTAQRDGSPASGYFRFNTTLTKFEGYNGTAWGAVGGGATGGGGDEIFIENGQTVTTNYTISGTKNAHSVGPITINDGVTVTVPDGSRWVVS